MKIDYVEEEVVVHPEGGMQLATGSIRTDPSRRFIGNLPGMAALAGDTIDEVLRCMERFAKDYYGDDVIVEIVHRTVRV